MNFEAQNIKNLRWLEKEVAELKARYAEFRTEFPGQSSKAEYDIVTEHFLALEHVRAMLLEHAEMLMKKHVKLMTQFGFAGENGKLASRYVVHTQFEKLHPRMNANAQKQLMLARNITQFARPVVELEHLAYVGGQLAHKLKNTAQLWWQRRGGKDAEQRRLLAMNQRQQRAAARNVFGTEPTGRLNRPVKRMASRSDYAKVNSSVLGKGMVWNATPTGRMNALKKNGPPPNKSQLKPVNNYVWGGAGRAWEPAPPRSRRPRK